MAAESGADGGGSAIARRVSGSPRLEGLDKSAISALTAFGLFSVIAMLVCYAFERRSPWWVLGFAISCWLGSAYGFLQGAWPFGIVEVSSLSHDGAALIRRSASTPLFWLSPHR
jgi:hypothetical protein